MVKTENFYKFDRKFYKGKPDYYEVIALGQGYF